MFAHSAGARIITARASHVTCNRETVPQSHELLSDDPFSPLHERDKNSRRAELRSPILQIRFRDPTGPGTCSSRKYGNVFRNNLLLHLAERRPAHSLNGCGRGLTHKVSRFSSQKNLYLVPGIS